METEAAPERIERLQDEITQKMAFVHRLAFEVSEHELKENSDRRNLLSHTLMEVESCYRRLPPQHHLELEVTPQAYYRLGGAQYRLLKQERSRENIRYLLTIGRHMHDSGALPDNKVVLNLAVIGGPHQVAHFALQEVGNKLTRTREFLWPQDILNILVKPDPVTR